jgi:two-component system, cell cycle response regulator DivK
MAGDLILLIEDNPMNRKLIRDVLQFKGYTLQEADNAEDGISLARELRPRLILMDLHLPGMDGIAALRQLRADATTKAIPVMALTASAMDHERKRIAESGFDGYQTKPIHVKEFVAAVAALLAREQRE